MWIFVDRRRCGAVSGLVGVLLVSCAPPASTPPVVSRPKTGEGIFRAYCATCHQPDGEGSEEAPPLNNSPWVKGPETRVIRILLHGLQGRIEIHGKMYDRQMPSFGEVFRDHEIAMVLTHVRSRFGGVTVPVTPAAVREVRAATESHRGYWSVAELLQVP